MLNNYEPHVIENSINKLWHEHNVFAVNAGNKDENFSVMMPPPNITGRLHMGHGFEHTLIDILTRYNRMLQKSTLWQPGIDHAGIATQIVVEGNLKKTENKTRHDIGREAFVNRVWKWKDECGDRISKQTEKLGILTDWNEQHFTMDETFSKAVKQAFIKLHEDGLIYRGNRLVNWDPKLQTAVSDLEVIFREVQSKLWHIKYKLTEKVQNTDHIIIATTRPETILADAAIAVHPDDERYKHLIGKEVTVPLCNKVIPIIADDYVEKDFGTGCLKITPAHDFNDYQLGKKHNLEIINILTKNAMLNENVPKKYQGLDRFVARKMIVADLKEEELLDKEEKHINKIPYSERTGEIIEPYLSDQWFIDIKSLAKPAIQAVKIGEVKFIPENAANLYFEWMNNIEDWCISRQLWWGHRIPVWYDDKGNTYVGLDEQDIKERYGLVRNITLTQEESVLDTWFSSALWPFATLGWPENTDKLKQFYPNSIMLTGFDIIFFWVARMLMFGIKFMGKAPFPVIYLHGLLKDNAGQKMSKSKGNVLDPVDLIEGIELPELLEKRTANLMLPKLKQKVEKQTKEEFPDGIKAFGADALRFTFASISANSRSICFDVKRLEGYRNFCNKLWNAAKFVLMNLEGHEDVFEKVKIKHIKKFPLIDKWIFTKLQICSKAIRDNLEKCRFADAANTLYDFVWHVYCDWYLEFAKIHLQTTKESSAYTAYTLGVVFVHILRLTHPFMPFITESLWQKFSPIVYNQTSMLVDQEYPDCNEKLINKNILSEMESIQEIIVAIRTLRSEGNIPPGKSIKLYLGKATDAQQKLIQKYQQLISGSCKASEIVFLQATQDIQEATLKSTMENIQIYIPLAGLIDFAKEAQKLEAQIKKLEQEILLIEKKLNNKNFTDKAPKEIVEKQQNKKQVFISNKKELEIQLTQIAKSEQNC
ncbi:MAG: valine--tRNA ligase [Thiotrichales bacterium]|nr:MAG: valine--tRNA ligase [Thiotrichales bacterium]